MKKIFALFLAFLIITIVPAHAAKKTVYNNFTGKFDFVVADIDELDDVDTSTSAPSNGQVLKWNSTSSVWEPGNDATGAGGQAVTLDLADDASNESIDLGEIATTGDTNSIFTEPSADKLLIDAGQNWPTADAATALETARTIAGVSFDGTANIAIASTGLSDTADLLYETELDSESELETQIADMANIIQATEIDTYSELNTIVADQTLTHNGLIDTAAELDAIVADENILVETEIDASSELLAIMDDETGTGLLVFGTQPTITPTLILGDSAADPPLNITERATAPTTPATGDIYLDDGTNTGSGNPGLRRYTGAAWEDINEESGGSGDITAVGSITTGAAYTAAAPGDDFYFAGSASPTHAAGLLTYSTDDEALEFHNDEADIKLQIGQEFWVRVRNSSGATISNGKAVYISGNHAGTGLPEITLARSDALSTSEDFIGLATHDIENNTVGYVTAQGRVGGLDTSAFSNGDMLWVDASTAGELTATRPGQPNFTVPVGTVTKANASSGTINVNAKGMKFGAYTDTYVAFGGSDGFIKEDAGFTYTSGTDTLNLGGGIDGIGAVDLDYGSADITDHTFLTDGTGTAEIVLPTGSIDSTEILDDTLVNADINSAAAISASKLADNEIDQEELSATLTFSDADYIDLSAILHNDTALQGLRLPQIGASPSNPTSGEGQIGYDETNNTVEFYNGSSWSVLSSASGIVEHIAGASWDGGGSAISSPGIIYRQVPFSCTITGVTILAITTGSATIDVWVDSYANYPPTDADSITASAVPATSSGVKDNDETLTGWTTSLTAGDVIGFNVDSTSGHTWMEIQLYGTRD